MSNRKELEKARRRVQEAADSLEFIENLPRRAGAQVLWDNGVLWTRLGDDHWEAEHLPGEAFPSAHVASGTWTRPRPVS